MNLLLDTHTYLWFVGGNDRLSIHARAEIENPDNRIFISIASLWEITVKYSLGKLTLKSGLETFLTDYITQNGFNLLPIKPSHLVALSSLPLHHSDPFDRLIIAQGIKDGMSICSADDKFKLYSINDLVW
jgi:PIN domain nuclease of toxin-antitoxin system